MSQPTDIVVHDNGSTDPETLQILDELEGIGVRVFRMSAIISADELNLVDRTVQAYFAERAQPVRYVVSDCDVDLSVADPLALQIYDLLLDKLKHVECVGPMLRISDIPSNYPLYNWVMNRHIKLLWSKLPTIERTSMGEVAFQLARIDTTFALHRAGEPFRRLKTGARVYEPFEALHLDWYKTGDDIYTETSSSLISHWDNKVVRSTYQAEALEYDRYYAVRKNDNGSLEVYQATVKSGDSQLNAQRDHNG